MEEFYGTRSVHSSILWKSSCGMAYKQTLFTARKVFCIDSTMKLKIREKVILIKGSKA
jgi:hypothetical protein